MATSATKRTHILLIEEDDAEAQLVEKWLSDADDPYRRIARVTSIDGADDWLNWNVAHAILIDIGATTSTGTDAIRRLRRGAPATPIIALTADDDDEASLACIGAGAQECLCRENLRALDLRRVVRHTMCRTREGQLRNLCKTLTRYHALAGTWSGPAQPAPMAQRCPELLATLASAWAEVLEDYFDQIVVHHTRSNERMQGLLEQLIAADTSSQDLIDIHAAAIDVISGNAHVARAHAIAEEGRLMILEMMGGLIDYHRLSARKSERTETNRRPAVIRR